MNLEETYEIKKLYSRCGMARHGMAWLGMARHGKERNKHKMEE